MRRAMQKLFGHGRSVWLALIALALFATATIGLDKLEHRFALKRDTSFNSITSQGSISRRVLDELDKGVHAYAISSRGNEDVNLLAMLERFSSVSNLFTYSQEDLMRNPNLARTISTSLSDADITADSLVVYCPETNRSRVLNLTDFVTQGIDPGSGSVYVEGLNYERSLAEAILYVSTDDLPSLQILSGHGELSNLQTASMESLLTKHNYQIRRVELLKDDNLHPETPLLILSPQKDLQETEVLLLDAFTRAGGSVFITDDYGTPESLPNFDTFYRVFGFIRQPGLVVADTDKSVAYFDSPAVLMPEMYSSEPTAGLLAERQTLLLLAGTVSFAEPVSLDHELIAQPVLKSGPAYLRKAEGIDDSIDRQPQDEEGDFILALLADRAFDDGTRARAFAIGNSSLFTEPWMQSNTYSGELLLNVISYLDPGDGIRLDIESKSAIRPPLALPRHWLLGLALLLPSLTVLALALVILLPRRRL